MKDYFGDLMSQKYMRRHGECLAFIKKMQIEEIRDGLVKEIVFPNREIVNACVHN